MDRYELYFLINYNNAVNQNDFGMYNIIIKLKFGFNYNELGIF